MQNRSKKIIQTSIIGIITNLGLVAIKAVVGLFANSISIIMDADYYATKKMNKQ